MTVIDIDCPDCQGEGFKTFLEAYSLEEPDELYKECDSCLGEGFLEVCAYCKASFEIKNGQECCACETISLPQAA